MERKKESSVAPMIHGVQEPSTPIVRKKSLDEADAFETLVGESVLNGADISETVKKKGNNWVVYDDKTGVQKGSYPTREDAWKKQRQIRQQNKNEKTRKYKKHPHPHADKAKKAPKPHLAKKPKKAPKPSLAPKPKVQKEQYLEAFKNKILSLISEGSALSYVFEQTPTSKDSLFWEEFLQRLSKQTLLGDPKLKTILQTVAKTEVKLLGNSVNALKSALESTGAFEVEQKDANQDEQGNVYLNFLVKMLESNKKLKFAVRIENGKPIIHFPEDTRYQLNTFGDDSSKLLRAELMHIQETILDQMEDLVVATQKRDNYLKGLQSNVEKALKDMDSLQIAMLKHILKQKYKGIK